MADGAAMAGAAGIVGRMAIIADIMLVIMAGLMAMAVAMVVIMVMEITGILGAVVIGAEAIMLQITIADELLIIITQALVNQL